MRNLKVFIKRVISFTLFGLVCLAFVPWPLSAYDRVDGIRTRFHTLLAFRRDYYGSSVSRWFPYVGQELLLLSDVVNKVQKLLADEQMGSDNVLEASNANPIYTIPAYKPRLYYAPLVYFQIPVSKDQLSQDLKNTIDEYNESFECNLFCQGKGVSVLVRGLFSVDIFRLRIGLGGGINIVQFNGMRGTYPTSRGDKTWEVPYDDKGKYIVSWSGLGLLGIKIWRNNRHTIFCDCMWIPTFVLRDEGGCKYYWKNLYNSDFGFTWESKLNHYFSYSVRLAYQRAISLYNTVFLDEMFQDPTSENSQDNECRAFVLNQFSGLSLQFGMSILIPDKRHCTIPGCMAKYDHNHNRKLYRGNACIR